MNQGKVTAVTNWPTLTPIKELYHFLGFANFYWRFIHGFSIIASPLTALFKKGPKSLSGILQQTFECFKAAFTLAPILKHANPFKPFIVKVDTSETGVEAILSQWFGEKPNLHLVAFFSEKLSPAQHNYDIGNQELLEVKLVLEEWCHWLEGACHHFAMLTDHKNLECLKLAKRLNSDQACWAMFFARFEFTISYRSGSKNIKVESLSNIYPAPPKGKSEENILLKSCCVGVITWEIDQEIVNMPQVPNREEIRALPYLQQTDYVGSHLPSHSTPQNSSYSPASTGQILVAMHGLRHSPIHILLFRLCPSQSTLHSTSQQTPPSVHTTETMVTSSYWVHRRSPHIPVQCRHHGDHWCPYIILYHTAVQ